MNVRDIWEIPHHPNIPANSQEFYCGVEYEIEDIKKVSDVVKQSFHPEVDHSLRNSGLEFKTLPTTYVQALDCFDILHKGITLGPNPYTDRTSIHVHVNVQNMEGNSLRQFILVYALLEPLFLNFVGDERKNSIFCVPLNYTYLPSTYKKELVPLVDKWHKYTAFNVLPVKNFGTVEFRHLYGTGDKEVFSKWITALKQLYEFIVQNPELDIIKELEAGKTPSMLAMQVVPIFAIDHSPWSINEMCKDTLLDVKLSVGGLK